MKQRRQSGKKQNETEEERGRSFKGAEGGKGGGGAHRDQLQGLNVSVSLHV